MSIDEKTARLINAYGITEKKDIKNLSDKINIVIVSHRLTGTEIHNPMNRINRLLNEIITTINMLKNSKN